MEVQTRLGEDPVRKERLNFSQSPGDKMHNFLRTKSAQIPPAHPWGLKGKKVEAGILKEG